MVYDIQKAGLWKRMSAYLFDVILLGIVAVGFAFLLSTGLQYDGHVATRETLRQEYEVQYGVEFDISQTEYAAMTEEEQKAYMEAYEAFATDPEVSALDLLIINLTLMIIGIAFLGAFLLLEFAVPLLFGNGQTLGKKIFSIGVMRVDGVRISLFQLFVRTILGKYTLETMLPVFAIFLVVLNVMPIVGIAGVLLVLLLQISFMMTSQYRTPIHDMISGTVTVDIASQMIFDSTEAMMAYRQRVHEEMVARAEYR